MKVLSLGNDFKTEVCLQLGLDPNEISRIIIDAQVDDIVRVYVEAFGTKEKLSLLPVRIAILKDGEFEE